MGLKYKCIYRTIDCGENSIVITFDGSDLIGFSIIKNKYLKNKKIINFEHVLLRKSDILRMKELLNKKAFCEYFSCNCFSEIIRVAKFEDETSIYFDVFDNYALKLKKGIDTSAELPLEKVEEFASVLDNFCR